LISLDPAGVPLDQTANENRALVKASFNMRMYFIVLRKGFFFEALLGCAPEVKNKAR